MLHSVFSDICTDHFGTTDIESIAIKRLGLLFLSHSTLLGLGDYLWLQVPERLMAMLITAFVISITIAYCLGEQSQEGTD